MGSSQEAFLVLKILQDIDTGVGLPTGCVRGGTPGTHPAAVRVLGCQGLRDMSMTATRNTQTPSAEQPFATTAEKYDTESASGKVTGSNFPYREVQRLPGYSERRKPGLAAVDVTNLPASLRITRIGRAVRCDTRNVMSQSTSGCKPVEVWWHGTRSST